MIHTKTEGLAATPVDPKGIAQLLMRMANGRADADKALSRVREFAKELLRACEQPGHVTLSVPVADGRKTKISIRRNEYDLIVRAAGSTEVVHVMAKAASLKYPEDSAMSRSAFVREQIGQALSSPRKLGAARAQVRGAGRSSGGVYKYVTVRTRDHRASSVSIPREVFAQWAEQLGGRDVLIALAKKAALAHKPESGVQRSAFVRDRLERAVRAAGGATAQRATRH